jgi:putative tricarboxylic transport membrane protein
MRDAAGAVVWLALAAYVAWAGWDLGLGTPRDPGPGFLLFGLGVVMAGLAVVLFATARPAATPGARGRIGKVVLVLALLVAYAWTLERAGFLITTTLVMIALFKAVEAQRWTVAIVGGVVSTAVVWLVFRVWLGAQLPRGFLELG